LGAYAFGFLLALRRYSQEDRRRLFADPKSTLAAPQQAILRLGQVIAIAFVAFTFFVPLTHRATILLIGLCLYAPGYALVLVALRAFRRSPPGRPAVDGPYRLTRNPQWVGLFLVLLGTAVTSGAWSMIVMAFAVGCIYHIQVLAEEKACRDLYGEPYASYLRRVPRYFVWF